MDYFPDGDIYTPGTLYDVHDFAPNINGAYKRILASEPLTTSTVLGTPTGAAIVKNSEGTTRLFVSSTTEISRANGSGGWTNCEDTAGWTGASLDAVAFDDRFIIAGGGLNLYSATANGTFSVVTGSPIAKILAVHANAVVAFNTTTNRAGWYRSATGDYTTWTASASNDADSGTLYGGVGGPVTAAATFGNLLIAWKSRAMYGAVYAGNTDPDQPVLRWQTISTDVGCVAQHAWVNTEAGIVFVSERDILLFSGGQPVSIADKVRKAFLAEAATQRSKIFCTLDEANNQVFIWYSSSGQTYCNRAFVWNYRRRGLPGEWGRLVNFNNTDPTNLDVAVCPVRNANYEDLVAIGGLATNSGRVANVFFGDKLLANLSSSTLNTSGILQTGFIGRPDGDSVLKRVHVLTDAFTAMSTTPTLVATVYPPDKSVSTNYSASALTNGAWWDVPTPRGRYVRLTATFPETAGVVSIADMKCEVQPHEMDKGWRLV